MHIASECMCPCVQIQKPKQDIGCLPLLFSVLILRQSLLWNQTPAILERELSSTWSRSACLWPLMWWFQVHTAFCVGAWDSNSGAHTCKANASLKTMLRNSFMHLCNRSLPRPCPSAPPLILLSSPLLLSGCAFVCQAYLEALAWAGVGGDLPFQRRLMSISTLTHWAISPAAMTLRASLDLTLRGRRHSLQMEECERVGGSMQREWGNKQESLVYYLTKQTYNQAYPT